MKKLNLLIAFLFITSFSFAQGTQLYPGAPIYHLSNRIGIGTSNPTSAPLHVTANTSLVQLRLERIGTSSGISADIGGHSGNLIFYPGGYSNKNGNVLFNTTGKVGIGTESPEDLLHLFSPGANGSRVTSLLIDGYSQSTLVDGSGQVIRFKGNAERYWGAIGGYTANSKEGMGIFAGNSTSLTTTPGLYLNSDQNVGIGTTSPTHKLSVEGNIMTKGENPSIRFNDNTGSTYESMLRFKDNKLEYLWGGGVKHTLDNSSFAIGDNLNGENEVKISRVGNSWLNGGNVGIGTTSPAHKLDVNGSTYTHGLSSSTAIHIYSPEVGNTSKRVTINTLAGNNAYVYNYDQVSQTYHTINLGGSHSLNSGVTVLGDGNVGLGVATPSNKLEVNGTIRSKKVKVEATGWPDYVFAQHYELRTLTELEAYINTNKHLPEVPSAKEMETNGLDLGDMDATLLKKVEELTLYILELEAGRQKLEVQNTELKKNNQSLEKRLSKIETLVKALNFK